jgi:hypothetical protein
MLLIGSGFGGVQPWWERTRDWLRLAWRCRRLSRPALAAVEDVVAAVQLPIYAVACGAVRETARHPQMRDLHYWREVGRVAKAWNWGENVYRRLDANERADRVLRAQGSTATHMDRELAVELAYRGLKRSGH